MLKQGITTKQWRKGNQRKDDRIKICLALLKVTPCRFGY